MEYSRSMRFYVGVVTAVALALLVTLGRLQTPASWLLKPESLLLLTLGVAVIPVAGYCPICIGRNVAVNMAGTVMFAMILLLPPAYATVGAAVGMVVLSVVLHWPVIDIIFNAGQTTLTVGAAAMVLMSISHDLSLTVLGPMEAAAIVGAVAAFFFVNSTVVTLWATFLHRSNFVNKWKTTFGRSAVPYLSTLLLGAVVAVTYKYSPFVTPILVLPVIAVYRSLQSARIIQRQTRETIEMLADTMDRRDVYTAAHSQRVSVLARDISERLGLPAAEQESITQAARVHDLGKVGISDGLLLKPERLSHTQLEMIRKHAVMGAEIVGKLAEYKRGKDYILFHHERYDGSGIFRLYGQHIPLGARIIAVADAYDAMTSDRPYRRAMSVEEALEEIEHQKGRQFDPFVAETLIGIIRQKAGRVPERVSGADAPASVIHPSPAPT